MQSNLKKVQAKLTHDRQAFLLSGQTNRSYATGCAIDEATALVFGDHVCFFTDSRYIEAAQRQLPECEIGLVDRAHPLLEQIKAALQRADTEELGIEEKTMTVAEYTRLQQALEVPMFFAQDLLDGCRVVKEAWELERMQQAQAVTDRTFEEICRFLRPGLQEREVYGELIGALYRNGGEGLAFDPIVVSGPNTSMPHGVAGSRRLERGDFVTLDFGARVGGYCSDMTRTVALGQADEKMREVYDVVLQAQRQAIAQTRAGKTGCEIDAVAREVIEKAGYGAYFGHGYGHCLGLEIHESPSCSPSCSTVLPVGAVCSAEPGIYLPGQFGVRIEDVVLLQENGCQNLTRSPKELIIL